MAFTCIAVLILFSVLNNNNSTTRCAKAMRSFPVVLLVVVAASVGAHFLKLGDKNVEMLGRVSGSLLSAFPPKMPDKISISMISGCLSPAFSIALLIFVESSLVAHIFSTKHRYLVSSNRELVFLFLSPYFFASSCFFFFFFIFFLFFFFCMKIPVNCL